MTHKQWMSVRLKFNFTLFAQYWLVPGIDASVIYMNRIVSFTIKFKLI